MEELEVRYAEVHGDYLAFSVFGEGPHDLLVTQSRFPIDLMWELPQLAAFMEALGRFARVIVFDARGCGASDPVRDPTASAIEHNADDVNAVLDAADSNGATLFDMSSGGTGVIYCATHPDRVRSVIVVSIRASFPELQQLSEAQRYKLAMRLRSPERLRVENPRVAHDVVLQRWQSRAIRLMNSPYQYVRNLETAGYSDFSHLLPQLRTPTLVMHRRDNRVWDIETSRATAAQIPGARFVELPGAENDIYLGDTAPVLAEIERFLDEPDVVVAPDRPLATVLFTDIVDSTQQLATHGDSAWRQVLDDHDQTMHNLVAAHRGRFIKQLGDGILATFDGPARAVRCADEIRAAAAERGITVRAGLHTGEIELRPNDVTGIAVVIAGRISALAGTDEILVSRTVVDLTGGSGLQFEARGEHDLKGVPGRWPVFAANIPA